MECAWGVKSSLQPSWLAGAWRASSLHPLATRPYRPLPPPPAPSHDPLLELAVELERAALADPYFRDHHLYPNVEFYSGLVLRALGIPITM